MIQAFELSDRCSIGLQYASEREEKKETAWCLSL